MAYYLTTHFKRSELVCKCGCDLENMNSEFMAMLEQMRILVDRPLLISSGFRCKQHNAKVGGVKNSYHTQGRAVDLAYQGSEERYELVGTAIRLGFCGVGIDKNFIHVDNRKASPKKIWLY